MVTRLPSVSLLAFTLLSSCAEPRASSLTSSSLDVGPSADGGTQSIEARWEYASSKVDVSILLSTRWDETCETSARVVIDEALSEIATYRAQRVACDVLRVEADGDLVLFDDKTGHDWASEPLDVDTKREAIRLGPWRDHGSDTTFMFELSSQRCADEPSCKCPQLVRRENGEELAFELDRRCD